MTEPQPTDGERLVRIETKLDVVVGAHATKLEDHEARIRAVEARKTVSPRDLWVAVTGGVAACWTAVQLFGALAK